MARVDLSAVAVGFALAEADNRIRETPGKNNYGARVERYLANCSPPLAAGNPWCAAWVQYVTDICAHLFGAKNPLDEVRLEAYVQSYYDWAVANGLVVPAGAARPGDLILFNFHGTRWDHIGFFVSLKANNKVATIEGNTSDASARDGDGVFCRMREPALYPVTYVRWTP